MDAVTKVGNEENSKVKTRVGRGGFWTVVLWVAGVALVTAVYVGTTWTVAATIVAVGVYAYTRDAAKREQVYRAAARGMRYAAEWLTEAAERSAKAKEAEAGCGGMPRSFNPNIDDARARRRGNTDELHSGDAMKAWLALYSNNA